MALKYRFTGRAHVQNGVELTKGDIVELNESEAKGFADKFQLFTDASDEPVLSQDGPTIEQYVAAGYLAENYPPQGFAEKESEALTFYKANGEMPVV